MVSNKSTQGSLKLVKEKEMWDDWRVTNNGACVIL